MLSRVVAELGGCEVVIGRLELREEGGEDPVMVGEEVEVLGVGEAILCMVALREVVRGEDAMSSHPREGLTVPLHTRTGIKRAVVSEPGGVIEGVLSL